MVEQATENRRVPSSNLGPGICFVFVVSYISPDAGTDRLFNNADSFAMVFDRLWKKTFNPNASNADLTPEEKTDQILAAMADHPFLQSSPEMAKQVAGFRVRLLDLN